MIPSLVVTIPGLSTKKVGFQRPFDLEEGCNSFVDCLCLSNLDDIARDAKYANPERSCDAHSLRFVVIAPQHIVSRVLRHALMNEYRRLEPANSTLCSCGRSRTKESSRTLRMHVLTCPTMGALDE